jgi:hypothetical protein
MLPGGAAKNAGNIFFIVFCYYSKNGKRLTNGQWPYPAVPSSSQLRKEHMHYKVTLSLGMDALTSLHDSVLCKSVFI